MEVLGFVFNVLRHCHTILAVSVLHSHQQCMGILISPYLPPPLGITKKLRFTGEETEAPGGEGQSQG